MKTRSAVLHTHPGRYEVTEVDLDGPREGELLVKMAAVGLCHTDDHDVPPGSSQPLRLPLAGGHEGAGVVVVAVGVTTGEHIAEAVQSIRKAGTVFLTGTMRSVGIPIPTPC